LLGIILVCLTDFSEQAYFTRLQVMMPGAALLVGLGVWAVAGTLGRAVRPWGTRKATLARVAALALVVAIPPLNLYQLLVDSPTHLTQTPFNLMLKVMREHPDTQMIQVRPVSDLDGNVKDFLLGLYPELIPRYGSVGVKQLTDPAWQQSAKKSQGQGKPPWFMVSFDDPQIVDGVQLALRDGYTMITIKDVRDFGTVWVFAPREGARSSK